MGLNDVAQGVPRPSSLACYMYPRCGHPLARATVHSRTRVSHVLAAKSGRRTFALKQLVETAPPSWCANLLILRASCPCCSNAPACLAPPQAALPRSGARSSTRAVRLHGHSRPKSEKADREQARRSGQKRAARTTPLACLRPRLLVCGGSRWLLGAAVGCAVGVQWGVRSGVLWVAAPRELGVTVGVCCGHVLWGVLWGAAAAQEHCSGALLRSTAQELRKVRTEVRPFKRVHQLGDTAKRVNVAHDGAKVLGLIQVHCLEEVLPTRRAATTP